MSHEISSAIRDNQGRGRVGDFLKDNIKVCSMLFLEKNIRVLYPKTSNICMSFAPRWISPWASGGVIFFGWDIGNNRLKRIIANPAVLLCEVRRTMPILAGYFGEFTEQIAET